MQKIIYICLLLLCGCATTIQSRLDNIQNNFANSNFQPTTSTDISEQNNLDLLINGIALFHDDKFSESDLAFEEFNKRNIQETSSSVINETTGLLFGQSVNSYKPYMMDSLFVSYYQIWDLLAMHDWANARVVINQSYDRQKNMSIEYKKMISENKDKIKNNLEISEFINTNTTDWLAFSDIMNPALMYLSGIYFLNDGDFDNAITYLKRANGMMPENTFIKQDLEYAQKRIIPTNTTWTFTDTGFAPRLRERSASILLLNAGIVHFAYSEPYLNQNYTIPQNAQLLANIDAMFMTEYNEYKINEILRNITSAAAKTTLQVGLYNSHNRSAPIFGIASSIYTISSTNVDVRTWATLPKYIYVERKENSDTMKTNKLIYVREINGNISDTKTIDLTKGENK